MGEKTSTSNVQSYFGLNDNFMAPPTPLLPPLHCCNLHHRCDIRLISLLDFLKILIYSSLFLEIRWISTRCRYGRALGIVESEGRNEFGWSLRSRGMIMEMWNTSTSSSKSSVQPGPSTPNQCLHPYLHSSFGNRRSAEVEDDAKWDWLIG